VKEKSVFEEDLKKLQKIVEELSSGKITLGEALKKYEEGVKIAQACSATLTDAQRKVEQLMKKDGKTSLEKFDDSDTDEK
jgi:exodeoxyribonuclease VII small subunit